MDWSIGPFEIALLIVGVVEALKAFGVDGVALRVVALALGVLFGAVSWGISSGLIPEVAVPYIVWGVASVASGLAAMGYFDLAKRTGLLKPRA